MLFLAVIGAAGCSLSDSANTRPNNDHETFLLCTPSTIMFHGGSYYEPYGGPASQGVPPFKIGPRITDGALVNCRWEKEAPLRVYRMFWTDPVRPVDPGEAVAAQWPEGGWRPGVVVPWVMTVRPDWFPEGEPQWGPHAQVPDGPLPDRRVEPGGELGALPEVGPLPRHPAAGFGG